MRELLKTRVWAGISAGSIVTAPTLAFSSKDKKIYYEETCGYNSEEGLGLVDFYVRPHFNSPHFPHANRETIAEISKAVSGAVYALDDMSALKVVKGKVEVITEGEYAVFD